MFIYNFKINGSKVFKRIFFIMLVILLIIVGVVIFKIIIGSKNANETGSCIPSNKINTINSNNYSNILKAVHENIDDYVGMEIKFTGYIYRVYDLSENQFILARDMIISSDFQSVVVGFLCEYNQAKNFKDNTWVELTGKITKGDYHGDMPIVKVTSITTTNEPNDSYVYPPDENYIPTVQMV